MLEDLTRYMENLIFTEDLKFTDFKTDFKPDIYMIEWDMPFEKFDKLVHGPWEFFVLVYDYCEYEDGSTSEIIHKYTDYACTHLLDTTTFHGKKPNKSMYGRKTIVCRSPSYQDEQGQWCYMTSQSFDALDNIYELADKKDFAYMFGFTGIMGEDK